MKKRLVALLMVIVSVLFLAGCGNKTEATTKALPGTWKSDAIDLSTAIGEEIASGGDFEEYADLLTPKSFDLYMILEFNTDGTFELSVDNEALRSEWSKYANQAGDAMGPIISAELEKELGMDVADILSLLGLSSEEDLIEMALGMSAAEYFESYGDEVLSEFSVSESGTWTVDGTKVMLNENDSVDVANYDSSKGTLTIEGEGDFFPMIFRRAK